MRFDPTPIKLNQFVFRDRAYLHPQLGIEVGREFFDRRDERRRVLDALTSAPAARSIALVGERRMGKTSLLRHIIEQLRLSTDFIPVQLPPGGSLHSADDFFTELIDRTATALELSCDDLPDQMETLEMEQQLDLLCELCRTTSATIVLCQDELDACLEHQETPPVERERITGLLESLMACNMANVKLLCTMIRPPERLAVDQHSTFLTNLLQVRLPPFSQLDMDEMMSELAESCLSMRLSDDELALLYEQSGGWPFFAKLILICLGEAEPGERRLAQALESAARHSVVGEAMEHIFRNYFDRDEKAFVVALAQAPDATLSASQLDRHAPSLGMAARHLVARDFVCSLPDGKYGFRIGLLGPWFRQWSKFAELCEAYPVVG